MLALHRYLDGAVSAPPDDWVLSLICEEFGCPPSVAVEQPLQLCLDIIELRAYARAKAALDQAERETDVPRTPMIDWVWRVQHEILREKRTKRGEQ